MERSYTSALCRRESSSSWSRVSTRCGADTAAAAMGAGAFLAAGGEEAPLQMAWADAAR